MDHIARKKHIETVRTQLAHLQASIAELLQIGAINHDEWEAIALPIDESDGQLELASQPKNVKKLVR
jgi:hypothetical protein